MRSSQISRSMLLLGAAVAWLALPAQAQSFGDLLKRGADEAKRAAEQAAREAAKPPAPAPAPPPAPVTAARPAPVAANTSAAAAHFAAAAGTGALATATDPKLFPWVIDLARSPAPPTGELGRWFKWDNQYDRTASQFARGGITPAQGQAWDQQLQAIVAFLKQAPVLAQPAGFFPEATGFITAANAGPFGERPKQAPLAGGITVRPWLPVDVVFGADGTPLKSKGERVGFRLELNFVYPPSGPSWMRDAQGEFGPLVKQGEYAGFPLIGNALVITRDGRLPFAPVSQERALRAFVEANKDEERNVEQRTAQARKAYADYMSPAKVAERQAKIEAEVEQVRATQRQPYYADQRRRSLEARQRSNEDALRADAEPDIERDNRFATLRALRAAKAQLAAMSEAERKRPAWVKGQGSATDSGLAPEGTPGAAALVAFDPTFFDARAPRHAIRIALVRELHNVAYVAHRGAPATANLDARVGLLLQQQIDWRAFAAQFLQ